MPQLVNAAMATYGTHAAIDSGPGVIKDTHNGSDAYFNNIHSRAVVTGELYTITMQLAFKMPVDKISFALSDHLTEAASKDLEIAFDDETVVKKCFP